MSEHCTLCGLPIDGGLQRQDNKPYHPLCWSVLEINRLEDRIAELEAENKALRETLADINNFARHTLVADLDAAADKLMKALSWNEVVRPKLAKAERRAK